MIHSGCVDDAWFENGLKTGDTEVVYTKATCEPSKPRTWIGKVAPTFPICRDIWQVHGRTIFVSRFGGPGSPRLIIGKALVGVVGPANA